MSDVPVPRISRSSNFELNFSGWIYKVPIFNVVPMAANLTIQLIDIWVDVVSNKNTKPNEINPDVASLMQLILDSIENALLTDVIPSVNLKDILNNAVTSLSNDDVLLQILGPGKGYTSKIPHEVVTKKIETEEGEVVDAYFVHSKDFVPKDSNLVYMGSNKNMYYSDLLLGDIVQLFADNPDCAVVKYEDPNTSDVFEYIAVDMSNFEFCPKVLTKDFILKYGKDWRLYIFMKPTFTPSSEVETFKISHSIAAEMPEIVPSPTPVTNCIVELNPIPLLRRKPQKQQHK